MPDSSHLPAAIAVFSLSVGVMSFLMWLLGIAPEADIWRVSMWFMLVSIAMMLCVIAWRLM